MMSPRLGVAQFRISVSMTVSIILACAAQMRVATAAAPTSGDDGSEPDGQTIQEVTVTANRREESVLSVPYNISAVTGSQLQKSGAGDVQSLSTLVPGLQAPNEGLRGGHGHAHLCGAGQYQRDRHGYADSELGDTEPR